MIKLLSVAIVAGLLFAESDQLAIEAAEGTPGAHPAHIQCWTDWFDRDDASGTGDWETLKELRRENPGKICPQPTGMEVTTLSGLSVAAAGEVIFRNDLTDGFVCRNQDQPDRWCNDYRVRFSCPTSFCSSRVCWTKWYDRDNPSGTGDWELLNDLRRENPGQICYNPLYIDVITTGANPVQATSTGQTFLHYSPTVGFVCRNADQNSGSCRDYKVRFGCPCLFQPELRKTTEKKRGYLISYA